jgi:hypothetical protein
LHRYNAAKWRAINELVASVRLYEFRSVDP